MQAIQEGLLKVDPGLMLWTIITFIILVLLLWKTAWKPVIEALDSRAEKIRNDLETAEKNRLEAEKLLGEHKEMMDNARSEAARIISEGKSEADRLKDEILEKANADAQNFSEKAKREIEVAKDKALLEIKDEVVSLSTEIASKIISRNLNPDDQKDLVEKALNKMGTVQ